MCFVFWLDLKLISSMMMLERRRQAHCTPTAHIESYHRCCPALSLLRPTLIFLFQRFLFLFQRFLYNPVFICLLDRAWPILMIGSAPIGFDLVPPEVILVVEKTIRDSPVANGNPAFASTPHKVVSLELCLPWWLPFGLFLNINWVSYSIMLYSGLTSVFTTLERKLPLFSFFFPSEVRLEEDMV